jgi:hypothetical protein
MVYDEYMDKKYYFLAGLQRSGNTLLSSILNQNPAIHSSPLSSVLGYMWDIEQSRQYDQNYLRSLDKNSFDNVIKDVIHSYHKDIKKPIIFDREKNWAIPANLELILKYIDPKPKIIFTERPLLEILESLINIYGDKIYEYMHRDRWNYKTFLSENDNKCDYLMQTNGPLDKSLLSYNSLKSEAYKDFFHIVKYDDIVTYPKETLDGIYNFLEIEKYEHDFLNIVKIEQEDDFFNNDALDLHKVRPAIEKRKTNIDSFFSEYVIKKYGDIYKLC